MMVHLNLLGHPAREISTQVRKPTSVVTACLKSPWAQDQIRLYHERFLASMQQRTYEPMAHFYDKLKEKIEMLDSMTRSENPSVALRALELWISHTLGSPVKRTEVKVDGVIGHASIAELTFIRDHGRMPTPQEKLMLSAPSIEGEVVE